MTQCLPELIAHWRVDLFTQSEAAHVLQGRQSVAGAAASAATSRRGWGGAQHACRPDRPARGSHACNQWCSDARHAYTREISVPQRRWCFVSLWCPFTTPPTDLAEPNRVGISLCRRLVVGSCMPSTSPATRFFWQSSDRAPPRQAHTRTLPRSTRPPAKRAAASRQAMPALHLRLGRLRRPPTDRGSARRARRAAQRRLAHRLCTTWPQVRLHQMHAVAVFQSAR